MIGLHRNCYRPKMWMKKYVNKLTAKQVAMEAYIYICNFGDLFFLLIPKKGKNILGFQIAIRGRHKICSGPHYDDKSVSLAFLDVK